jgi:outer membrane protein assembly factor BamB
MSDGFARLLPRGRWLWLAIAALVLLLAGAALGAYFYERNRTGSIYHPNARFIPQPTPTLPASVPDRFSWPLYGYTKNHTRFFPAGPALRPPFRTQWVRHGDALLEFPPVLEGESIFQLADNGVLSSIDKRNGHTFWSRRLGELSAACPAVVKGMVYATVLARRGGGGGRIVALTAAHGAVRWARDVSSRTESSPLVDKGKVFFGSESGKVYAMDARNGNILWTYQAPGAVKASPSLSGGVLYFGDYSGQVQAVSEQTGRRLWISGSEGALLGSGNFYSTSAVVYGRVFLGNTDGRVYSYDASTGKLDWAVQTGAYVYASPAVTNAPGIGPTIYLGSYDGTFYALNAQSGRIAWKFNAGQKISGSATIVGRTVYFADLGQRRTYGLDVSTGRVSFEKPDGGFDPVISDGHNIYLTGYTGLFALAPR